MPSPLDRFRHAETSLDAMAQHQATAPVATRNRLPYPDVLREFAALLGAQLAREHLAEARTAGTSADAGDG